MPFHSFSSHSFGRTVLTLIGCLKDTDRSICSLGLALFVQLAFVEFEQLLSHQYTIFWFVELQRIVFSSIKSVQHQPETRPSPPAHTVTGDEHRAGAARRRSPFGASEGRSTTLRTTRGPEYTQEDSFNSVCCRDQGMQGGAVHRALQVSMPALKIAILSSMGICITGRTGERILGRLCTDAASAALMPC